MVLSTISVLLGGNMNIFNFFWIGYIIVLFVWTILVYRFDTYMKKRRSETIFLSTVCGIYLFLGIFSCLFTVSNKLDKASKWDAYQKQVIIPIEDRYHNAEIPDGYYYLGTEIVSVSEEVNDGIVWYTYDFGTVDYEVHDEVYQFTTNQVLYDDIPYLLVMDSLGTDDITDDQIVTIWGCLE